MYVYMYVCIYVCIYVCMYVCIHVCMYVYKYVCMYVYMYVCICMYVPYMTEYTPGPVFPLASYLARRQYEPGVYMSPGVY